VYRFAAHFDLLVKATHFSPATNIKEVLLEYRKHPQQLLKTIYK
jgi:hypothetical protein